MKQVEKELVLIRHSSLAVPRGVCYGFSDIDVSENFPNEANHLRKNLNGWMPDLVVSSPLQRCVKLAKHIFNESDIRFKEGLKEVNYGDWEGKTWEEINTEGDNLWMYTNIHNQPPNGESFSDLQKRVVSELEEIVQLNAKKIAIVCHGGVIRSILSHFLKTPLSGSRAYHIHYTGFVKFLKTEEGWRLSFLHSGE